MSSTDFKRLPTEVKPKNYKLSYNVDLQNCEFHGRSIITVEVVKPVQFITVNACDLEIKDVKFNNEAARSVEIIPEKETVTFTFPAPLSVGEGKLSMDFTGKLNDKLKGFYRSRYTVKGESKYMATTQFEPTDARYAFPCWDEPSLKATFDIDIMADSSQTILSNSKEIKTEMEQGGAKKHVYFDTTPIMSTYLVAFVVSELEYNEKKSDDGVLVRVYTTPGNVNKSQFALDVACKTLPFYRDLFGVGYPLPKLDLIAIPDFAAGAMENWGLVTYRETALFVDPNDSSAAGRQRVAIVVGHELAHQWFGNLVTMEWWTHLWLNEGFATWVEYLSVDHCLPDYKIWDQFIIDAFSDALDLDALTTSHPIEVEVRSPSEIDEIFDKISYSKGASIIRMLNDFLSPEVFKRGLQIYLKRFAYKNAFTEDLWAALDESHRAAGGSQDVAKIMSTWTSQMGYPVVTVEKVSDGKSIKLTQKRFLSNGQEDSSNSQWLIPITFARVDDPSGKAIHKMVLDTVSCEVPLPSGISEITQIRLNPNRCGFYRVAYADSGMFESISKNLHQFNAIDKLAVLNDLFALARSGKKSATEFMEMAMRYSDSKQTEYIVWNDILSNLGEIRTVVEQMDIMTAKRFDCYISKLLEPVYRSIGWDEAANESHTVSLLRGLVLSMLGRIGHPEVLEEGRRRFQAHFNGQQTLPSNLRGAVYTMCVRHGSRAELDVILKALENPNIVPEEHKRMLAAMGRTSLDNLPSVLGMVMDEEKVRSADMIYVIMGACCSADGNKATWNFCKENWKPIRDKLPGLFLLGHMVKNLVCNFASKESESDVKKFFESIPKEGFERALSQALECISVNIQQVERDGKNISAWLEKQDK